MLSENELKRIVRSSISDLLQEVYDFGGYIGKGGDKEGSVADGEPEWFDRLNELVQSEGWPGLKIEDGVVRCIDEDTQIEFGVDSYSGSPYISKVRCNFLTPDPAHIRDLNGLVSLFEKLQNIK